MDEPSTNVNAIGRPCACFITGCWHSIRTHLIVLLTLVVTVVYGIVAFIEITEEIEQSIGDLHRQVKQLSDVQSAALSVPLWNLDRDEVARQLNVLVVHRDIAEAEVLEADGTRFALAVADDAYPSRVEDSLNDHSVTMHAPTVLDVMLEGRGHVLHSIESEIKNERRDVIGVLRIAMTHRHLDDLQSNMFWSHFKQFLVITLVIAVTIGMAVTSMVRPVLRITAAMDDVAAGDLTVTIPATDRLDEIGKMARALEVFKANAEQLQTALNKERELNGLQRQFVSMVSHEFRTPLAVIDGNAQRMLRRMDHITPERMADGLTKVRRAVIKLTELMDSVLNAARLEEGRIDYNPVPCSLPEILSELSGSYADLHPDRAFETDLGNLPDEIVVDPKLLRQVFSNLLSNACKYSTPGSRIWIEGHRDELDGVSVSVRDEGVGIPQDELKRLFERFFRATTSTGVAGTGIGLHLVQHFVALHGGRVDVTSTVGEGTAFIVHIPDKMSIPVVAQNAA